MRRQSAADLGIAPDRAYTDYAEMARAEAAREDGIEAVSIVTPNHVHVGPAKAFLEAGIHVICDKPLSNTLEAARELAAVKPKNGAKFLLTHNYTGYPLVRQARQMIADGKLGTSARRSGRISAGLADRRGPQQAGRLAHRSRRVRARAAASAISAPTPTIWRAS